MKQTALARKWALVGGALALMTLAAACGSSATDAGEAAPSRSVHTGHSSAPAAPVQPLRAGENFVTRTMPAPYTPAAPNGGTDEYRCIIIDPQLTKPVFLTGSQFQPKNESIVHHAITYALPPSSRKAALAKDAATPGEGWTCFGSDGLGDRTANTWVDTWTPKGTETVLTQDVGYRLEPGSLLLLQVHYNLLAGNGSSAGSDQSSVRLRLTDGTPATKALNMVPLNAPIELPCTSGETGPLCDRKASVADVGQRFGAEVGGSEQELLKACGYSKPKPGNTQQCDFTLPQSVTAYAALGHMHLLGRSIKIEANPGTATSRTLLDVPAFNFDDQKFRPLAKAVELKAGDKLRVTCTHDAGLRKLLPQLKNVPPRYVVYGDGTTDEMCLGLVVVSGRTQF
jgi:copper type II ascorbate-dependent monooxygenase-like protein